LSLTSMLPCLCLASFFLLFSSFSPPAMPSSTHSATPSCDFQYFNKSVVLTVWFSILSHYNSILSYSILRLLVFL
jgi:hypothetical protein